MNQQDSKPYGTPVVIGAGIARPSSAAATSGPLDRVIVLDAKALPEVPLNRRGVPHGHRHHELAVGGPDAIGDFATAAHRDGIPLAGLSVDIKHRNMFQFRPRHPAKSDSIGGRQIRSTTARVHST